MRTCPWGAVKAAMLLRARYRRAASGSVAPFGGPGHVLHALRWRRPTTMCLAGWSGEPCSRCNGLTVPSRLVGGALLKMRQFDRVQKNKKHRAEHGKKIASTDRTRGGRSENEWKSTGGRRAKKGIHNRSPFSTGLANLIFCFPDDSLINQISTFVRNPYAPTDTQIEANMNSLHRKQSRERISGSSRISE